MASVDLLDLWIHDAADPTDYLNLWMMAVVNPTERSLAEVRWAAGGGRQAVVTPGLARILNYRVLCTEADFRHLVEWAEGPSPLVLVRDETGDKLYGLLTDLQRAPVQGTADGYIDVAFTVSETTFDEAM
jgi:hypothetical protein